MQTEIEAKFLNINIGSIRAKLKSLSAELVCPERVMRRRNFDFEDHRLERVHGWARVRDEGNKITLSYKQLNDRTLHGTKEVSINIQSFDDACDFLTGIGLKQISYQTTKRESWVMDGIEIEIDTWPWIPTFLEIEGKSEESVIAMATKLGFEWGQALFGSVEIVYRSYYDVSEAEIDAWPDISFTPIPDWLEKTRLN